MRFRPIKCLSMSDQMNLEFCRSKIKQTDKQRLRIKQKGRIECVLLCQTTIDMFFSSPVQVLPSPENPALHEQLYEPSVLMHIAFTVQS